VFAGHRPTSSRRGRAPPELSRGLRKPERSQRLPHSHPDRHAAADAQLGERTLHPADHARGRLPHEPVAAVVPGELELELLFDGATLRGGFGTTGDGVLANEAMRLWMHAVGSGTLMRASDGRAEIASGTLMGYLALGRPNNDEGELGTCSATDHTFSLRIR
jgi:hypothetical protein